MQSSVWRQIESLPGTPRLLPEWEEQLGSGMPFLKKYLHSTGEQAKYYPCRENGGDDCPRNVVVFSLHDILAVCANSPKVCEDIRLKRSDITLHRFDVIRLCSDLAKAMKLEGSCRQEESDLFQLGERTFGARSVRFFLHFGPMSMDPAFGVINRASGNNVSGVALIVSNAAELGEPTRSSLLRAGVLILSLSDALCTEGTVFSVNLGRFILESRLEVDDPGGILWPYRYLVLDPHLHRYWLCGQLLDIPENSLDEKFLLELVRHPGEIVSRLWMVENLWPRLTNRPSRTPKDNEQLVRNQGQDISNLANRLRKAFSACLTGNSYLPVDPKAVIVTRSLSDYSSSGFFLNIGPGYIHAVGR